MKVVDSDKLRAWIAQNEFESVTPVPPEPPIPPIPPTPGDAIPLSWNQITPIQGVPQGSTIVYVLNNQDMNKQSGIVTVYTIALSTNITCSFTHPNGTIQGPYNATYGLSIKFRLYYPIATGPYILRIYGNESGTIQVRAL